MKEFWKEVKGFVGFVLDLYNNLTIFGKVFLFPIILIPLLVGGIIVGAFCFLGHLCIKD